MAPAESHYTVGDKELLAIFESLKEYWQFVCNLATPVGIITDHRNLTAHTTKRILNQRQARWVLELVELDFMPEFRPGIKNPRADALTRRSEDTAGKGKSVSCDLIVSPLRILSIKNSTVTNDLRCKDWTKEPDKENSGLQLENSLLEEWKESLKFDDFGQEVIAALKSSVLRHSRIDLGSCKMSVEGLLMIS